MRSGRTGEGSGCPREASQAEDALSTAAELFRALSSPARIRIIELLKARGALRATDLAQTLGVTVPAVSQHLKILQGAGLVRSRRQGYAVPYAVDATTMDECLAILSRVCDCGCRLVGGDGPAPPPGQPKRESANAFVVVGPEDLDVAGPVMVIAAHPDDVEIQAGGTLAMLADRGCEVVCVLCTSGNRGSHSPADSPVTLASIREAEQQRAARLLGVSKVVFLGYDDGDVCFNLGRLREDLVFQIRSHRPLSVLTHDPVGVKINYDGCYLHPDHRAVAEAATDAALFCSHGRFFYPAQLEAGLAPHRVTALYFFMSPNPDCFVDISSVFDRKLAAIAQHRSQWGNRSDLPDFFGRLAARVGAPVGLERAEAFKVLKRG